MKQARYEVSDLLRVMVRLRDPATGCPWDLRQDFRSIVPSTLEECYELAEAIEQGDFAHVAEELGDVLFQVIFYAELGREQGLFSFEMIVDTLVTKLLRRHPHVFGEGDIESVVTDRSSVESVKESWEAIKQSERRGKSQGGVLADIPVALPALPRAQKLQKRAAQVNFDWTDADAVLAKLEEEILELRQAMQADSRVGVEEEMGDILFSCANLARHLGLDAEASLRRATSKFERRFSAMEAQASGSGKDLQLLSAEAQNELWEAAKREERGGV